jgi:hypothetical protein
MKMKYVSVALSAGLALALTLGRSAQADTASQEASPSPAASSDGQARLAETTQKLESAFADQFVQGRIDRAALATSIRDVVNAMPEGARPKVQQHIDQVLGAAEKLAPTLTAEQRARSAAPAEKIGSAQQAQVTAWGWPSTAGFGGFGAFGFPSMYGLSCGNTWNGVSWSPLWNSSACTTGYNGGWFW